MSERFKCQPKSLMSDECSCSNSGWVAFYMFLLQFRESEGMRKELGWVQVIRQKSQVRVTIYTRITEPPLA